MLLTPFELRDGAATRLGVDASDFGSGPFDDADDRWRQRERGEITEREYWHGEAERFGLDIPAYMANFYEPSGDHLLHPESVALVDEVCAAGFRAGVLTNDLTAFHAPGWHDHISLLDRVDPLVDLSHTGHLKPHPQAYDDGVTAMGVPAGEIVYVDDHLDNVEGGRAAGLVSIWFDVTDPAGSLRRTRQALAGD